MAESKPIKGDEFIEPNYLGDAIEQIEVFIKLIKETKKSVVDLNKVTSQKLDKAKNGSSSKEIKEANALMAEAVKQRKIATAAEVAETRAILDVAKAKKLLADFEKKKFADDEKQKKAIEQQNSAYAKASARLNKLKKDYKDLAIEGRGAEQSTKALLKSIQELDKELKKVDADTGDFKREVGNYKNEVKGAIAETDLFTESMSKLGNEQTQIIAGFSKIVDQLKGIKKGQDEATKSSTVLGRSLKALGIVAIITAIASLFSYFTASREGLLQLDLLLNKLKATIDVLIGSFAKLGKGLILYFSAIGTKIEAVMSDISDGFGKSLKTQALYDESAKKSKEATELLSTAFDGNTNAIIEQSAAYDKLTKEIFAFEDQLRILQVAQEKLREDEEDYNEIQADTTLSLNEQKKALEGAIESRLGAAKIGQTIARTELELAKSQLELELRKNKVSEEDIALAKKKGLEHLTEGKLSIKVSNDSLNAVQEKYLAEIKASDVLDDLDRQESERRRQIVQTETIDQIELIRSKKLGADEQVKILTQQVADEKNQLEDRERFEEQLRSKQLDAQNEEVKLFEKFIYARYKGGKLIEEQAITAQQVNELISEKDAVLLAKKIKATNLSVIQQEELAKVILEAQTNDLAYEAQKAKFEEERIKREQKILQLNREIFIINEQSTLSEIEKIEAERQRILDESNEKVLQSNNVFNKKLLNQRKQASLEADSIIEEEYKIKEDLLQKQYELDQENIKNSVNDEKIREKELEKLKATFDTADKKLEDDKEKEKEESRNKELEANKAIELKRYDIILSNLEKGTAALSEELDKRQAIQDQNASNQIDKTQTQIDKQRDLAARGLANTLAFQEEQLDKQKLKQQDAEKRAAKQKENSALVESLFNAYNAELKQPGANPTTAAEKAFADVLLFKGLAAGFVQFAADGNDRVQGQGTSTSDSIPFMLSKDEGVVKASANMDNPGAVSSLNNGTFDKMYIPRYELPETPNTGQSISNSLVLQSNKEVIDLLKDIKNKPVQHVNVDNLNNLIETTYKDGLKTVTKYKNRRSIG